MGRKRAGGDPLGLAGTRLAYRRNKFWYRHRDGRWESVGTDIIEAKRRAATYNEDAGTGNTMSHWLDMFLIDCEARVAADDMSARTLKDYRLNVVELKVFFGDMHPDSITPETVQSYLDEGKRAGRAVRANRERACLSSCLSWLMRTGKCRLPANPCMRASGVKRNTEGKRERYVTDEEYRAVYDRAPTQVRLMMDLVYRTLQRPESDVIFWTPANIRTKGGVKVLLVEQNKTGTTMEIALDGHLAELVNAAIGDVPVLRQPIIHTRQGEGYTYDGISAMLKRAQEKARKEVPVLAAMEPFGFRDIKGKGATDMWLAGVPIEQIQLLCGHKHKSTTETYVKARWRETVASNSLVIGG